MLGIKMTRKLKLYRKVFSQIVQTLGKWGLKWAVLAVARCCGCLGCSTEASKQTWIDPLTVPKWREATFSGLTRLSFSHSL